MRYSVYDVPGRAEIPFEADDLLAAQQWVESKLPPSIPKNATRVWTESGGGTMLVVRRTTGEIVGHYWLRRERELSEVGSADIFAIAVVGVCLLACIAALYLIATNGLPT